MNMDSTRTTLSRDIGTGVAGLCHLRASVRVGVALAALCVAAQVRIPVPGSEVPMTLQSLAVLLVGFLLTPKQAVSATGIYLLAGAVGMPVFASSVGLFGATGGYLFGFVVAAWLISILTGRGPSSTWKLLAVGVMGTGVIFVCGVAWRALGLSLLKDGFEVGWAFALQTGFWPFAAKSIIQLLFAVTLVKCMQHEVHRRES